MSNNTPDTQTAQHIRTVIDILDRGGITQAVSQLPENCVSRDGVVLQTIFDSIFDMITRHVYDAHVQLDLLDYLDQVFRGD